MTNWRRRSVLTTGATLATGSVLSSAVTGEVSGDDDLPDPNVDPNPETDAVWPAFDGDAGHARYAADAPEFDGEALEAAWTVERASGGVAVVDGVVYTPTEDGVAAFDAADGTVVWEVDDRDLIEPAVAGDTVYFRSRAVYENEDGNRATDHEEIVALNVSDGSVRWEVDFDEVGAPTVAYGAVFVFSDGTLYAREADDGSIRWENETITTGPKDHEEYDLFGGTAAANGVIYTAAEGESTRVRVALNPDTGDVVWHTEGGPEGVGPIRATSGGVALGQHSHYARHMYDPLTGEERGKATAEGVELVLGEDIYIGGYYGDALTATSISDDADDWGVDVLRNVNDAAAIGGDTVYLHINDNAGTGDTTDADDLDHSEYHDELVALNKYNGSERWTISADDRPIGHVVAIDDETLYVEHDDHEGEGLVALREQTGDNGDGDGQEDDDRQEGSDDESKDDEDAGEGPEGDDDGDAQPEESDDDERDEEYDTEADADGDDDDRGDTDESEDTAGDDDPDDLEDGNDEEYEPGDVEEDDGDEDDDNGDDDSDAIEDGDDDTAADEEADSVPGFTTGAGLVGGAVGLEWVRRRAATDASVESRNETGESADEPAN
ncbi:outer membrane protein assembly factor BamB family protein [Natronococcus occultus]|uniref:WD40-like repeat protein n=1 Tax=Natronococcus occultus SP4 TaxID=694430 RepID=L0JVY3_9EURY|nr:PQQ-binding-like beta-propeller repeat protein [Natronococcus occultus]AGB36269.1 WD40-like repeat protein [Natronococcus occultus SP4]